MAWARDARNVGKHESTIGGNFAYASVVKTKLEASTDEKQVKEMKLGQVEKHSRRSKVRLSITKDRAKMTRSPMLSPGQDAPPNNYSSGNVVLQGAPCGQCRELCPAGYMPHFWRTNNAGQLRSNCKIARLKTLKKNFLKRKDTFVISGSFDLVSLKHLWLTGRYHGS
ncbi:hypothetical protein EAG_11075 [Camponotus floridanus]|uniref:Uncharacterized protein n=1 Tax=Camponotus floridanus TaxID=104421 RepID=E1ZW44_CAMFO|nr:hypothetical protein EAG_11075 [Camponotus floridanus]